MWALMSNQGARRYLLWLKNRYVLTILEYVSWGHRWPAGGSHSYAWDHESGFCGNRSVPTALETAMWYSSAWTDPQYHLRKYIQGILCYRSVHITFIFFLWRYIQKRCNNYWILFLFRISVRVAVLNFYRLRSRFIGFISVSFLCNSHWVMMRHRSFVRRALLKYPPLLANLIYAFC